MADPLSIAASIAGLVALADLVYRATTDYVKSAKSSQREVNDLYQEIKNLSCVLHNLSLVAFELEVNAEIEAPSNGSTSSLKPHHLHDVRTLLRKLEKKLCGHKSQLDSSSSFERLRSRMKWPFSAAETKEMLQKIRRQRETIDTAVAADTLSKLMLCLSRQEESSTQVENLQVTANRILDMQLESLRSTKKRSILNFFSDFNYRTEFETNVALRHPMTGLWLTEGQDFAKWHATLGSKIWFTGIPGAGKSVIAALIIQECLQRAQTSSGTAVAFHYSVYRNQQTHQPQAVLSSLCIQLALQDADAFKELEKYHTKLNSAEHLPRSPSTEGLIAVLRRMSLCFNRVYIIVDGVDECGDHAEATAKSLLDMTASRIDDNISLAVLSRDEIAIRHILDPECHNLEIAAHTEDLQQYVATELNQRISSRKLRLKNLHLKDEIMTSLVEKAQGMFRWVACQLDHLCDLPTDRSRREALLKLPPTLPAIYERILLKVEGYNEKVKRIVQRALLIIGASPRAFQPMLGFREICELASIDDDSECLYEDGIVDEEDVLRWCGCLVRTFDGGYYIQFAHFTVQEYLQNDCAKHNILRAYSTSDDNVGAVLGPLCIRYLMLKNHELPVEAADDYIDAVVSRTRERTLREYTALEWLECARKCEAKQHGCFAAAEELFQLSKTASFCSWSIELIGYCLIRDDVVNVDGKMNLCRTFGLRERSTAGRIIYAVLRADFTPLHMAAALGMPHLCQHLLKQGANVSLRSKFGTPLQCAVASLTSFADCDVLIASNTTKALVSSFVSPAARRRTVQLLIEAGAIPSSRPVSPSQTATLLHLAVSSSTCEKDFEIVADLVRVGVSIEEADTLTFKRYYDHAMKRGEPKFLKDKFSGGRVIIRLLEALHQGDGSQPAKTSLYYLTFKFAQHLKLDLSSQAFHLQLFDESSESDAKKYLFSVIESDDGERLQRFLQSGRSDLARGVGIDAEKPSWTSLHLAVRLEAPEILVILLKAGFDPNLADENGSTPAHLCCRDKYESALRLLLKHGASTTRTDFRGNTIWHLSAKFNSVKILKVLLELRERDQALESVSDDGDTPIAAALGCKNEASVRLLLPYCSSERSWKCGKPLYRAAARLGIHSIIQGLMEAQLERDGENGDTGNPLHYLRIGSSLECIRLLKKAFPIDQRRAKDSRTPLESMLVRAVGLDDELISDGAIAELLPSNAIGDPSEASKLWLVVCEETILQAMTGKLFKFWFNKVVTELGALGIPDLYETQHQQSAMLPFIAAVTEDFCAFRFGDSKTDDVELLKEHEEHEEHEESSMSAWSVEEWRCFSACFRQLAQNTRYWASAIEDPSMVQLLSLSILQGDRQITSLLLAKGVNIHARTDVMSPFDLACFPDVHVSAKDFDHLLSFATTAEMERGAASEEGCGPLHFAAGFVPEYKGSVTKLSKLLQKGINCSQPVSPKYGSPLTHHIKQRALKTAEMLLRHGADPWAIGPTWMTPTLMATQMGDVPLLQMIATASEGKDSCHWNHAWGREEKCGCKTGGNALHLAALNGKNNCLSFYLEQDLLSDLEAGENDLGTPLHHAAHAGHSKTVELLEHQGADVNTKDTNGRTALHVAVSHNHLETVEVLLRLGALHQADVDGRTPIDYALDLGQEEVTEALLESFKDSGKLGVSVMSPKVLLSLADAFAKAIRRNDVDGCSHLHAAGCPVDIELSQHRNLTPLIMAISENKSLKIVRWLLSAGASVSATVDAPYLGQYSNALEAASEKAKFNPILLELTNKYLKEGGDILGNNETPLHFAVYEENTEGVSILLDAIKNVNCDPGTCGRTRDTSYLPDLAAFINHQARTVPAVTALHVAAAQKNAEIVRILVEAGANVDNLDDVQKAPLHCAAATGSLDIVEYLIGCGAKVNTCNSRGDTPLAIACREGNWQVATAILNSYRDNSFVGGNVLHLTAFNEISNAEYSIPFFRLLLDRGADMHLPDANGISPAHIVLVSQNAVYLRSWINRDITALRLHQLAPWPAALFRLSHSYKTERLCFLSKNLQVLRRLMTKEVTNRLLACESPGSHSLLCWSVCCGEIGAIQPFVKLSHDVLEHQCHEHGTPLQAALSFGRSEIFKCLVHLGARLPYDLLERITPDSGTIPHQPILDWLLVGRHGERARIGYGNSDHTTEVKDYAGPALAEVPLRWEWKQSRQESMWQYACRRSRILTGLRGETVRPVRIRGREGIVQTT